MAPLLIVYNSVPPVDHIKTKADSGTLTVQDVAMSTGEIALNVLPLLSRAKPLTAGWFAVETANWGGRIALMGGSAFEMARELQATHVAALAQEYQQFLELQANSLPSDPGLAAAEAHIRAKAAAVDGEISRQFTEQVKTNAIQIVVLAAAGSAVHHTSAKTRTAILERLAKRAAAQADDGTAVATDGPAVAGGNETAPPGSASNSTAPDATLGGDYESTTRKNANHPGSAQGHERIQAKPGRVTATVPGLWESIDPNVAPAGWLLTTRSIGAHPDRPGHTQITTDITAPDGSRGWIQRSYEPVTKSLVLENAFLDQLPAWIEAGTPLVEGKGIPTVTYFTIVQMKRLGSHFGEVRTVKMSTIQNVKAVMELEQLRRKGLSLDEAIAETHSVRYATTGIQQSGHDICKVRVDTGNAWPWQLEAMMDYFEPPTNDPTTVARRRQSRHELYAKYGLSPTDEVLVNYDIIIDVFPFGNNPEVNQ